MKSLLNKVFNTTAYKIVTTVLSIAAVLVGVGLIPSLGVVHINFEDMVWGTATLNGHVNPQSEYDCLYVSFIYGNHSGGPYPFETLRTTVTEPTKVIHTLEGLKLGAYYYYRIKLGSTSVNEFWLGEEKSFVVANTAVAFK